MSAASGEGAEILQTLEVIIKPFHLRMSGVEVLSRAEPQIILVKDAQTRVHPGGLGVSSELHEYCTILAGGHPAF